FEERPRRTRPLKPRSRIENIELGLIRMEPDQHAVGTKPEGVTDNVPAGRNVKHTMFRDSLLNESSLIAHSIAFGAEGSEIDPRRDGRQAPDRVGRGWRQACQRRGIVAGLDFSGRTQRRESKSVGKDFHQVDRAGAGKLAAALAEARKDRHLTADDCFEIDLRHPAVLIADEDCGAADVFKARVFYPKLVGIV